MKWYHWIGIAVVFVAVLLLWLITGGKGPSPMKVAQREVDVVNAKTEVKQMEARIGAERALAIVEETYRGEIDAMDNARRKRAAALMDDPAKLAAFIVRGQT